MTGQPSPPSRAWRAQAAAPETPAEESQRWRREADALPGRRGRSRTRARRFALGFLFLAVLLAAFVWVILWLRPALPKARVQAVPDGWFFAPEGRPSLARGATPGPGAKSASPGGATEPGDASCRSRSRR